MSIYSNNLKNEFFINNSEISNLHFQLHPNNPPFFRIKVSKEIYQTQFEELQKKNNLKLNKKNKKKINEIKFIK